MICFVFLKVIWMEENVILLNLNSISLLHDLSFILSHVTQASGIAISDNVIEHYNSIRVRQAGTEAGQRLKLVVMCLSKDQKSIVVDEENCLKVKDVGNSDVLKKILSKLPTNECRYALYDCSYVSKESVKEDLVFILSYEAFASHWSIHFCSHVPACVPCDCLVVLRISQV